MKALLALAAISILWLPYCFVLIFGTPKAEEQFHGFLFHLIDWAQ